jgi:hypothetical protein
VGDFLLLLWDAISASAFVLWFLIGAILGVIVSVALIVTGVALDLVQILVIVGGSGLASVALRFLYWRKSR